MDSKMRQLAAKLEAEQPENKATLLMGTFAALDNLETARFENVGNTVIALPPR
jgi:hypothetical protein